MRGFSVKLKVEESVPLAKEAKSAIVEGYADYRGRAQALEQLTTAQKQKHKH